MARRKVTEEKRRKKITATVDNKVAKLLDKYMEDNDYNIGDKSRLIEKMIKSELSKKNPKN